MPAATLTQVLQEKPATQLGQAQQLLQEVQHLQPQWCHRCQSSLPRLIPPKVTAVCGAGHPEEGTSKANTASLKGGQLCGTARAVLAPQCQGGMCLAGGCSGLGQDGCGCQGWMCEAHTAPARLSQHSKSLLSGTVNSLSDL